MSPMPEHVVAHLVAVGRLDNDGISRRAHASLCRKCGAVVMRGLDHDKSALTATVDPVPLTAIGEVEVLMAGRVTYDLAYTSGGYRLDPREAIHIRRRPAGSTKATDVVAEHRCGAAPPSSGPSRILAAQRGSQAGEQCPF